VKYVVQKAQLCHQHLRSQALGCRNNGTVVDRQHATKASSGSAGYLTGGHGGTLVMRWQRDNDGKEQVRQLPSEMDDKIRGGRAPTPRKPKSSAKRGPILQTEPKHRTTPGSPASAAKVPLSL
jgi:hypothetical protein